MVLYQLGPIKWSPQGLRYAVAPPRGRPWVILPGQGGDSEVLKAQWDPGELASSVKAQQGGRK